jgi:hypothetical protein
VVYATDAGPLRTRGDCTNSFKRKKVAGNDRRKQQKLAKKKAKRKAKARAAASPGTKSVYSSAKTASQWELYACNIDETWQEQGLGNLIVARISPDGATLCMASVLIDFGCLGIKDVAIQTSTSRQRFDEIQDERGADFPRIDLTIDDALKILLTARDYGLSLDFPQGADFDKMLPLLGDAEVERSTLDVPTGRDGKPFFMAGPSDNANAIIKQLTDRLGPDGFHFVAPLPM